MDFCWAAGVKINKKKKSPPVFFSAPQCLSEMWWISMDWQDQHKQSNERHYFRNCPTWQQISEIQCMHVHLKYSFPQFRVNTILSCFLSKKYSIKMCLMHDSSGICGAQFLSMSVPSSHCAVYPSTQFYFVIYSRSLRTSQPHHHLHQRLHPVWSLSSFSTGSRGRRKPREEKRCGTKRWQGPHLFALVRSCQSLQLSGAEELAQTAEELLCSCQSCSLMLLLRGSECRRRGQQSSARRPTGCFK